MGLMMEIKEFLESNKGFFINDIGYYVCSKCGYMRRVKCNMIRHIETSHEGE